MELKSCDLTGLHLVTSKETKS